MNYRCSFKKYLFLLILIAPALDLHAGQLSQTIEVPQKLSLKCINARVPNLTKKVLQKSSHFNITQKLYFTNRGSKSGQKLTDFSKKLNTGYMKKIAIQMAHGKFSDYINSKIEINLLVNEIALIINETTLIQKIFNTRHHDLRTKAAIDTYLKIRSLAPHNDESTDEPMNPIKCDQLPDLSTRIKPISAEQWALIKKEEADYKAYEEFKNKCKALPQFDSQKRNDYSARAINGEDLQQAFNQYFKSIAENSALNNSEYWVNGELPKSLEHTISAYEPTRSDHVSDWNFDPYVEKMVFDPENLLIPQGDIHGDVHSLIAFIEDLNDQKLMKGFKIANKKTNLIFLGDYTDRGWYGGEVIYTILQLKINNPGQVFLIRGNHEDLKDTNVNHDFNRQLRSNYCKDNKNLYVANFSQLYKFYETLPLALYGGTKNTEGKIDWALYCHGAIEVGFKPSSLFSLPTSHGYTCLGTVDRLAFQKACLNDETSINKILKHGKEKIESNKKLIKLLHASKKKFWTSETHDKLTDTDLGFIMFQWCDVMVNKKAKLFLFYDTERGACIDRYFTQAALQYQSDENNTVYTMITGHKHSDNPNNAMMKRILNTDGLDVEENRGFGVAWPKRNKRKNEKLRKDNVYTCNVCPNAGYASAGFDYATYVVIRTSPNFSDWMFKVHRLTTLGTPIAPPPTKKASNSSSTGLDYLTAMLNAAKQKKEEEEKQKRDIEARRKQDGG